MLFFPEDFSNHGLQLEFFSDVEQLPARVSECVSEPPEIAAETF